MLSIEFKQRGYNTKPKINTTNTDTQFQKVCQVCKNSSYDTIQYNPLKTMRHTDNISQKMKYASFVRRSQENTIVQKEAINFRFRNL